MRHGNKLRYFFPDWEDKVDPGYDFALDQFSANRSPYSDDIFAHEIFEAAPYDGILVSKSLIEAKPGRYQAIMNNGGIKRHLHLDGAAWDGMIVMGDCGAFSYLNEMQPPEAYSVRRVVDFYQDLGFDLGVAPDHLVVNQIRRRTRKGREVYVLTAADKERRRSISLDNAQEFWDAVSARGFPFVPVASAQGWDEASYVDASLRLHGMGYETIALGAMVRKPSDYILRVLRALNLEVDRRGLREGSALPFRLHLFGIGRLDIAEESATLGVTSFDNRSHYRSAWTRERENYLTRQREWYAAIRVPQSDHYIMRRAAAQHSVDRYELEGLERAALDALKRYENRELGVDETLGPVLEYDRILFRDGVDGKLDGMYRKTLSDRPWEQCSCPICSQLGIDVIIFRGGNRNRRRGFHNMKVFYDLLQKKLSSSTG